MIITIIIREFLDNLKSFKLIACVLVAVVLVIISTIILTSDYHNRLEDYNKGVAQTQEILSRVPVYSYLEFEIYKKPSPLSIFVSGIERNIGNHVSISHREIPTSLKGGRIKNEFSRIFSFFDLSSIIIIIFTLLAILLSYESVSGEKEGGLLSLVLSNSVPRYRFLLGKYLGGFISLLLPLTLCFLIGILIVLFSKGVAASKDLLIYTFILYLLSILYLSAVLLIGIFISTRTKTSFNSLIFLLSFYLIAVFLLPISVEKYGERIIKKKAVNYENSAQDLVRERYKEIREKIRKIPVDRSWAAMSWDGERVIFSRINPEDTLAYYKRYFFQRENIIEDHAIEIYNLKKKDFQIEKGIRRIINAFLTLLPSSNLERAAKLISATGRENLNHFLQQISRYWHQLVRYLDGKDAFSLRYFYPYAEGFNPEEMELISKINQGWDKDFWGNFSKYKEQIKKYNQRDYDYLGLNDMPVFKFYKLGFAGKVKGIFLNILLLFFYNLLFFILAHFSFNRYDPRFEL